ncbi:D-glycero-beta-D-manno-heptose 1,7-bisphosphate 7-phosphatase [Candidatus Spongiihabitans sp.]|uniref:D-glycero-beta-D-manno-heptose 1,7-bisphosphate 7-phosphatase n=1 Tax=Candidatus Spongiihabitans sp. TaxID=3101308 RepID=UPI003C79C468
MENSKLIILDRDGVINHNSDDHIKSPEQWVAIPGSLEAISRLCREDYRVVVITNQSGISRGLFTINTLNKIHQKMLDELHHSGGEISAIFFCPHSADDQCECRKPKPGMFLEVSKRLKYSLKDVYAVGDSVRDLQAAATAGAMPVLVETGNGLSSIEEISKHDYEPAIATVPKFKDLSRFVDNLLSAQC